MQLLNPMATGINFSFFDRKTLFSLSQAHFLYSLFPPHGKQIFILSENYTAHTQLLLNFTIWDIYPKDSSWVLGKWKDKWKDKPGLFFQHFRANSSKKNSIFGLQDKNQSHFLAKNSEVGQEKFIKLKINSVFAIVQVKMFQPMPSHLRFEFFRRKKQTQRPM